MANALLAGKEEPNPKRCTLLKTARVIQEKQVYKFSIWNTVTITKTCINTLNSNCSAVALLNRKWANSQDLTIYLLFSEWKKNTVPIHVTSEQRRGPLTHTVCWSDHPPLDQGGSKTEEQVSLEQHSTLQAICTTGYALVRHLALAKRSLILNWKMQVWITEYTYKKAVSHPDRLQLIKFPWHIW